MIEIHAAENLYAALYFDMFAFFYFMTVWNNPKEHPEDTMNFYLLNEKAL